jgi:hypothetical protein
VYRVLGSRTELYLIEAVLRAGSGEEAEAMFYGLLENEGEGLSWIQDLDSSDAEIDSIELLDPQHHAVPSQDRKSCLFCGRPVTWTGTPAAHRRRA